MVLFEADSWMSHNESCNWEFNFLPALIYYCWDSETIEDAEEHSIVLRWLYFNFRLTWYKHIEKEEE